MLLLLVVVAATLLAVRAYDAQRGPPLQLWHTHVPHDMRAADIDKADWAAWLKAEEAVFREVRTEVVDKLDAASRTASNRYFAGSPIYPGSFKQDWNRSYVLEPDGPPVGAVVLLHGLTDAPYSLRHVARRYRDRGFVAIGIRLPAHGTVPAALTDVEWEDWDAATRLAVREARRRAGPAAPLHIVGFSNGGALAVKYALDALEDSRLVQADRLILVSPMIGITAFARFAGLAALPAMFPAFASAWLGIIPEFNPFKYNSFPVNGARQSHRLTVSLQDRLARAAREGRLQRMPPILTFQSVVDFTVSTRAVIASLYALLPANGSELVLFDLNRAAKISSELLRNASETVLTRILADPPRNFRTTIIANVSDDRQDVQERVTEAGAVTEQVRDLGLAFPAGLFSLSHVALPFPMYDALYGLEPNEPEKFGVNLGAIAPRGERGVLIVDLDALVRVSSNPFFPYILERLGEVKP